MKPRVIEQFMQCERLRSKLLVRDRDRLSDKASQLILSVGAFAFNQGSLSHILVQQLERGGEPGAIFVPGFVEANRGTLRLCGHSSYQVNISDISQLTVTRFEAPHDSHLTDIASWVTQNPRMPIRMLRIAY